MYEEALEDIILKYDIDRQYPQYRTYIESKHIFEKVLDSLKVDKTVLFVVGSEAEKSYFENVIPYKSTWYIEIIDDNQIIKESLEYDSVIVLAYNISKNISRQVGVYSKKIIFLYDYLESHGIINTKPYFDYFDGQDRLVYSNVLNESYRDYYGTLLSNKKKYKEAKNTIDKLKYLEKLIFDFINIRDFKSVFSYIEELKQYDDKRYVSYIKAYEEIIKLINTMKCEIKRHNHQDINMLWIDQLEYGKEYDMPFLKEVEKKCLVFDNAYTVTGYTHATFRNILCEKMCVSDRSYRIRKIHESDSKLIRDLKGCNIETQYYGFSDKISQEFKINEPFSYNTPSTLILWSALCDMAECNNDKFRIIHLLTETHVSCISPDLEIDDCQFTYIGNAPDCFIDQRKVCQKYIDGIMRFYTELFNDNSTTIFMSDHGWTKFGKFHTNLKIMSPYIKKNKEKRIFSYVNFANLIRFLSNKRFGIDYDSLFSEYAMIQDIDIYSHKLIKAELDKKILPIEFLFGYMGVITKEDMLIRYNSGFDEYYKFNNDNILYSQSRVEELSAVNNPYPEEIKSDLKFRYTKYVYEVLGRYFDRTGGAYEKNNIALLDKLFDSFTEDSNIAIRCGGEHTYRMIQLLSPNNREKIKYIIDNDTDCLAAHLGYKVIRTDEITNYNIQTIVVSSFNYGQDIAKSLKDDDKYKVIEIYEYLRDNGILCKCDFYDHAFIDDDFEVNYPKEFVAI